MTQSQPEKRYEILDESIVFKGFFSVREVTVRHSLYQGGWSHPLKREVFHRGECVAILLYDPRKDAVVIIEQFRPGAMRFKDERAWLLEIVAGAMETGESPEDVARRESLEEAGCPIQHIEKICAFFTSPGGTSEWLHLFCGIVDSTDIGGFHGVVEENEDIAVSVHSFKAVQDLLNNGKIISAIPIIAIQWLIMNHQQLQQRWT